LQTRPDDPFAANNLAFSLIDHGGDMGLAVTLAQTARQGLPHSATTADTLGWAYYTQGLFPSAVDMLRAAIEESPEDPTYHFHLGMAYQKINDSRHAKEQLERALELHPSLQQAGEIRKALNGEAGG